MTTTAPFQLLPPLSPDDYERLKADIAERGIMVPVEVDEDGEILDGHHRLQIARELDIDCPRVVRPGMAEHEKRLHAVALNLARRHLTDAQKVLLGAAIEPDVAERSKRRMAEAGAKAAPGKPASNVAPLEPARTVDEVAAQVGLGSGRTYERSKRVLEKARELAPEVADRAAAGELTVREVAKEVRQVVKEQRVAAIAAKPPVDLSTLTEFPVLYVDPPWRYEYAETNSRKIENHYPTMTGEELAQLEIPAAKDAVLFMWATSPKLAEALDLMAAWGFEYRTCAVWVKSSIGMGYYFRQRHELLLVGKRGNLPAPDDKHRPDSVQEFPRAEHSAKPSEFRRLISFMYSGYPKVELFARENVDGWASWGNQA